MMSRRPLKTSPAAAGIALNKFRLVQRPTRIPGRGALVEKVPNLVNTQWPLEGFFSATVLGLTAVIFVALWMPQQVAAMDRTVEFRDGTILRVTVPDGPLPWHKASSDGTVTRESLPWERVDQLYLVDTPALEKLAEIKKLLNELGANHYALRVQAHKTLIEKGIHFRGVVEETFKNTRDPEIRWRLENVLGAMKNDAEPTQFNYDLVTLSGGGEELEGDVGDWELEVGYRGTKVKIDRKNVCRINRVSMPVDEPEGGGLGRVETFAEDNDEFFPKNVTRIHFDRGPGGELMVPGRDIKEMFVPLGCTLHSEVPNVPDSFISVEDYNVKGRSGKFCAATHDPLYQGTIVVRFCLPGNAGVPAGVHTVGFWTAYIEPQGTALEAYDVHDRLIGVTKTRVRGNDFLALKSKTPIAYIKVTPDLEIDEDHAIDDLFFDPPVTLAEATDPDWLTVLLTSGERIKCRSFEKAGERLAMKELSVGIDSVELPLTEVLSIMPATKSAKRPDVTTTDCTVLLEDGSILRAHGGEALKSAAGEAIPTDKLVALWGFGSSITVPEDEAWPETGALLVERDKVYKKLPMWKLGEKWIEAPELELFDFSYSDSPIIWFKKPTDPPKGAGVLRRTNGEEYVLDKDAYAIADWSAEKVTLRRDKTEITVPFEEVLSLRLPRG